MTAAYSKIAFTSTVRALQERLGSRRQYEFLDEVESGEEQLGEREAAFIESRDTLFQATVGETGWPYVQHRGGPVGFIKVLDKNTIAYPDFRGNVQYLSVGNLSTDDRIAIILLDSAKQRRLKLLGHARVIEVGSQSELFEKFRLDAYDVEVERAFVIRIVGFDWNCPQHIVPRFTEKEVADMTAPLRLRAERAERQLSELTSQPGNLRIAGKALGQGPLPLVITAVRQLTARVRSYELRHAEGKKLPPIEAGAHLSLPVHTAAGTPAVRQYSVSSAPGERLKFEVAVLREEGGRGGSAFVHDVWTVGTQLRAEYPMNLFKLCREATHSILIAGGIGITPLRSMALQLLHEGASFELHHLVKSEADAAYQQDNSAELQHRFKLHPGDASGRVDVRTLLASGVKDGVHVYVCGPAGLIDAVREAAKEWGLPAGAIHSERFGPAPGSTADAPVEVRLHRSGKTVLVSASESILEAVERVGVAAPASCRIGVCGTCAVRVLSGEPDHRDEALSRSEPTLEPRMCICVSRARSATLELDL